MRFTCATVALLALVPAVSGHSQLNSPAAWNPRPSKRSPCGGGAATSPTVLVPGQDWDFDWQVVAGDGRGPVTIKVDAAAGTNFGATVFTTENFPNKGRFPFKIPAAQTAGLSGPITLQLKSSTNWYACASINAQAAQAVTDAPTSGGTTNAPTTAAPRCQTAAGLQMCAGINGKSIAVAPGRSLAQMESGLLVDRDAALGNPAVFDKSSNAGCIDALTKTMCAMTFPACAVDERTKVGAVCQNNCQNLNNMCVTNPIHADLFLCTDPMYSATTTDITGACPAVGAVGTTYEFRAPALLTPLAATGGPSDSPTQRDRVTNAPVDNNGSVSGAGMVSAQPLFVAVLAVFVAVLF